MPELDQTGREEFRRHFPVSHETEQKLERFAEMLADWNSRINLVADSTLPIIWQRHFLDSAQLMKHMPENVKTLADLGSGAGFPGIILSILGFPETHLIESTGKKANFLSAVVEELKLNAVIHPARIESICDIRFDVITARALKPMPLLLEWCKPLMKKESVCLFLKGQQVESELTEAHKYWNFETESFSSLSDHSGRVLKIQNLTAKIGSGKNDAKRKARRKKRHTE